MEGGAVEERMAGLSKMAQENAVREQKAAREEKGASKGAENPLPEERVVGGDWYPMCPQPRCVWTQYFTKYSLDLKGIQEAIKQGADINREDEEGDTPLLLAVLSAESFEPLATEGFEPSDERFEPYEELYLQHSNAIKILLSLGARYDILAAPRFYPTSKRFSPLGYAIHCQLLKTVEILLRGEGSLHVDCHDDDNFPKEPLEYALHYWGEYRRDDNTHLRKASREIAYLIQVKLKLVAAP